MHFSERTPSIDVFEKARMAQKLVCTRQAQVPDLERPQPTGYCGVSPDGRSRTRRGPERVARKG